MDFSYWHSFNPYQQTYRKVLVRHSATIQIQDPSIHSPGIKRAMLSLGQSALSPFHPSPLLLECESNWHCIDFTTQTQTIMTLSLLTSWQDKQELTHHRQERTHLVCKAFVFVKARGALYYHDSIQLQPAVPIIPSRYQLGARPIKLIPSRQKLFGTDLPISIFGSNGCDMGTGKSPRHCALGEQRQV